METYVDSNALELLRGGERNERFLAFRGSSMEPTLCAGQMLEIASCALDQARLGDVIAFRKAGWDEVVVHRVIGRGPHGLRTCGDSNEGEDPWLVRAEELAGRVVAAWRGSRRTVVAGGRLGQLRVLGLRARGQMMWMARVVLRSPYRWLAAWRIFGRLLPPSVRPRLVRFQTQGGHRLRVMVGKRVAGWFDEQLGEWVIQRPYRLLVQGCGLRVSFEIPRIRKLDLPAGGG